MKFVFNQKRDFEYIEMLNDARVASIGILRTMYTLQQLTKKKV